MALPMRVLLIGLAAGLATAQEVTGLQTGATVIQEPPRVVELAGKKWEYARQFDCWHNDLATFKVDTWGGPNAIADREMCAEECLKNPICVAFNFPNEHFHSLTEPQVCYLKVVHMRSLKLRMSCRKGFDTQVFQYYSLLESDVWHRLFLGFQETHWPFNNQFYANQDNLETPPQAKEEWAAGARWMLAPGSDCVGQPLATVNIEATPDGKSALENCAEACLKQANCVGLTLAASSAVVDAPPHASAVVACKLQGHHISSYTSAVDCSSGQRSDQFTTYALADIWYMTRDREEHWLRRPQLAEWVRTKGNACALPWGGDWDQRGMTIAKEREEVRRLTDGAPPPAAAELVPTECCQWALRKCGKDINATCEPLEGYPVGCASLCGALQPKSQARCACWGGEKVEGGCCTKCTHECGGEYSCLPAGCDGPQNMCEDEHGKGAVCDCEGDGSQGANMWADIPADVAAGWSVEEKVWVA